MNLSNKKDRYKILDEFETGPHCTIYFEVNMPLIAGTLGLRGAIIAYWATWIVFENLKHHSLQWNNITYSQSQANC